MIPISEVPQKNIDQVILAELRKPNGILFSEILTIDSSNFDSFLNTFKFQVKSQVNQARKMQFMAQIAKAKANETELSELSKKDSKIIDALEYINSHKDNFPFKVLVVGYSTKNRNPFDQRLRGEYLSSVVTAESLLVSNGLRNDIKSQVIGEIINKTDFQKVTNLKYPDDSTCEFAIYILEKQ